MKGGLPRSPCVVLLLIPLVVVAADPLSSTSADYRIGPGDVLLIRVWNDPRLDGPVTVDKEGSIRFPMIGNVAAKNLTAHELADSLTRRLAEGYIRQPHVTVVVLRGEPSAVYVLGAVKRPGAIAIRGEAGFGQVLALAGGLTPSSNRRAVVMRREPAEPGHRSVVNVDVGAFLEGDAGQNIPLKPGDTVVFPSVSRASTARVFVFGEARKPGVLSLKDSATLLDVVARAGGGTEDSDGSVEIIRVSDAAGKKDPTSRRFDLAAITTGRAGRDVPLRDGDVLHFPRRRMRSVYVLGKVLRPGAYTWKPGTTVFHVIMEAGGFTRNANRDTITISRVNGTRVQQIRADGTSPIQPDDVVRVSEGLF
jgi:polysaccharide export outer membrane protein